MRMLTWILGKLILRQSARLKWFRIGSKWAFVPVVWTIRFYTESYSDFYSFHTGAFQHKNEVPYWAMPHGSGRMSSLPFLAISVNLGRSPSVWFHSTWSSGSRAAVCVWLSPQVDLQWEVCQTEFQTSCLKFRFGHSGEVVWAHVKSEPFSFISPLYCLFSFLAL